MHKKIFQTLVFFSGFALTILTCERAQGLDGELTDAISTLNSHKLSSREADTMHSMCDSDKLISEINWQMTCQGGRWSPRCDTCGHKVRIVRDSLDRIVSVLGSEKAQVSVDGLRTVITDFLIAAVLSKPLSSEEKD